MHFSHAAPGNTQLHQSCFGSGLVFDAGLDAIVLARSDLYVSRAGSDPALGRYAQSFLDQIPRPSQGALSHDVRRALQLALPRGQHGMEQISRHLGLSPRTLQRQLEHAGTSFQKLLNDERRDQALRYLDAQNYPVSQIADLLGFAETSAFSRWFAQQFGQPPSRWQRH